MDNQHELDTSEEDGFSEVTTILLCWIAKKKAHNDPQQSFICSFTKIIVRFLQRKRPSNGSEYVDK